MPETSKRRRSVRRAAAFACAVQSELWDDVVHLPASNLSEEGVWIETPIELEPGEPLILSFTPPGACEKVWAAAEVVRRSRRRESSHGIALAFTYCSESHRQVLARALHGQPPRLPGSAQPPPLPSSVRSLAAVKLVSEPLPEITHGQAPSDAIVATVVGTSPGIGDLGRATMQVMDEELRVEARGQGVERSANATMPVRDEELFEEA